MSEFGRWLAPGVNVTVELLPGSWDAISGFVEGIDVHGLYLQGRVWHDREKGADLEDRAALFFPWATIRYIERDRAGR